MNQQLGLSSAEAERRYLEIGANELKISKLESALSQAKKILLDPMGLMLLVLSGVYAALGDKFDSVVLLIAFIPVTAVDVILELRARNALKKLRSQFRTTAKVLRDGQIKEIPTAKIVNGDVIVFEEGQSLPADGKVIEAEQLNMNEAALTGESTPVEKTPDSSFLGGTIVLQGRGLGQVEQTGKNTQFGKIASLIEETEDQKSPLYKKVNHLIRQVVVIALILACLLFFIEYLRGKNLIQSFIVAMTFGMAAIPEEFPLVFTLYLSLSAWRLSKFGVLVKSLPGVEALGGVDVICTDKTGTLTEGKFQLEQIYPIKDLPEELLWQCALMACEEKPVDAMETAIVEKASSVYLESLANWKLKWDYPFERLGKHMSHVWIKNNSATRIVMKGAIEGILEHCQIEQLDLENLKRLTDSWASEGKRLLGLAYRDGACTGDRFNDERDLQFIGVLIFNDPIRISAKDAIADCQQAGITIKMLTGDHPMTAHAVADQTGILHSHELLFTGHQLSQMSQEQRMKAYRDGAIFSRVVPEQKYEMVQALKSSGKIVAMTGDGINDAPALKLADIGISMGANATDVARSTAQMILLENDFKGIVAAVFEGRKIFSNLRRSFAYLISFHIPVITLAFIPPLLGWGDLLLPIHIVLLELIVHPVSAFSFENLEQSKQSVGRQLMPARRLIEAGLSGTLLSLASLVLFYCNLSLNVDRARSLALATVILGNISLVFVEGWPFKTTRMFVTALALLVLAGVAVLTPEISHLLHLQTIAFGDLGYAFGVSIVACLPSLFIRMKSEASK